MNPTPSRTKGAEFSSYVIIGMYKLLVPLTKDDNLWSFASPFPLNGEDKTNQC